MYGKLLLLQCIAEKQSCETKPMHNLLPLWRYKQYRGFPAEYRDTNRIQASLQRLCSDIIPSRKTCSNTPHLSWSPPVNLPCVLYLPVHLPVHLPVSQLNCKQPASQELYWDHFCTPASGTFLRCSRCSINVSWINEWKPCGIWVVKNYQLDEGKRNVVSQGFRV